MLDKILKVFFVKSTETKINKMTVLRKTNSCKNEYQINKDYKSSKIVKTCLSEYFSTHRGLNLVERGYSNFPILDLRNKQAHR